MNGSKSYKKKKGGNLKWIIITLFVFGFLGSVFDEDDSVENTIKEDNAKVEAPVAEKVENDSAEEKEEIEVVPEETETEPENFLASFANATNQSTADVVNDVLLNKIGFQDISFSQKLGETSNYEIVADGTYVVVTAIDDYCRVFIPNTSYVFYDDGDVLMTASDFESSIISENDKITYYIMAKEIITDNLVNPASADFPSLTFSPQDIGFAKTGDVITVQSYVDAKNALNATIRSKWTVQFIPIDFDTYTYNTTYINIDGESSGTYTEIE